VIDKLAFNGTYEENINLKCFRMYQVYHVTHALFYQDFLLSYHYELSQGTQVK